MPPDRRPIPGRTLAISRRITKLFVHSRITANSISLIGLVFGIAAGVLLGTSSTGGRWFFVLAALCIFLRLLCNMFDGMVAIEGGKQSRVGAIYNELPDRLSDAATLIGAGYALAHASSEPILGSTLGETFGPTLGYIAALLAVLTAYIRTLGKAEGAGNDFCGPMAKPHRMWTLIIACVISAVVPGSWLAQACATFASFLPQDIQPQSVPLLLALAIIIVGSSVTCVRRTLRIARRLREMPP